MERLPEAIAEFRIAIRLKPDYAKAYTNLGSALALQGDLNDAVAEFTEALRLQPDLAEAKANLEQAKNLLKSRK
jgi:tetratricopeptide (TPR) repeat protein